MKKKLFWALTETVWLHHKPPDKDYRSVKYNQHRKIFIMYIKKIGPNLQTKSARNIPITQDFVSWQ